MPLKAHALTFGALALAVALRWLLDPVLGNSLPLVTLYGAIALAVWVAGPGAAAAATLLGYVACAILFIPPRGGLSLDSAANVVGLLAYLLTCSVIIGLGHAARTAERRTGEREEILRVTLAEARRLASIVESSEDAIISNSLDGIVQSWNRAAERLFGYRTHDAVGRHISFIVPEERITEEDHILANLREGQRIEHFETERLRSDGTRIQVSLTVSPIKDEAGNIIGASKFVRDITARKLAEAERQSFVTLIENSTDFIGMCDLDGISFFINRAGLQMIGLDSVEEAKRRPLADFFFPEDQARLMQEFFPSVLATGHGEIDVRFRHFRTGEARWMSYKVITLNDTRGRPTGFATVSQDVTERRRLTDDLSKLAADLREVDQRKNEFLATLAHELRNALAPLTNMLEVLKRASDADLQRRARETMDRQLRHLVRLVDDLLDLNRISHNRLELRPSEVELTAIVQHAVEASRPLADGARHTLQVSLPPEPILLRADPARLMQVFSNLLNNCCKYTPPQGHIWVTVERDGSEAVVSVKDSGVGIPHDKLDAVFGMFTQLGPSQGGLGIGLTLVKQLIILQGGSIEARSAGPGQGSEFIVRLPVPDLASRGTEAQTHDA